MQSEIERYITSIATSIQGLVQFKNILSIMQLHVL